MDHKKILIAAILLLAILTVGAVSASQDADALAQDSDVLAQDADVLAQESYEIVSQDNAIYEGISSLDDEFEGNFTFSMDPISTTSGQTTFATLNLPEATEGIVLVTTEDESLLFEKDLSAGNFNHNSEGYSYNILVRDVDFDNLDQGKQFLNFRFYDSGHNQVIHEYYQVDYNKGSNMLVLSPAIYLEIYDGLITDDNDDPIIVVYADLMQLSRYALTIGDEDYTWGYYPTDLTYLTLADGGLYTKNHFGGWFYYGVNAARLEYNGLDSTLDGKTLDISVRKLQNGMYQEWMAQEERTITFEYGGFYLEEDVVNPTLILEVYGNEYMPIDYENGAVFSIIISGDEKTGQWKPVDELSSVRIRVVSGEGGTEFLNVTLNDLDYTATGSMNNIEHTFYLSDVNDFGDLNDGDSVRFYLKVPPYPEDFVEYTIYFGPDGIILTLVNEDDPEFDVKEEIDTENGDVFGILLTQEQLDNRLGSGIIEVVSSVDDVFLLQVNVSELEFESYGDGIIGHYFTLSDLNNFSGLSDGDQVIFALWQYEGDEAPWIQKIRVITFSESTIYLDRLNDDEEAVLINPQVNIADSYEWVIDIDPNLLPQYLNDGWMINVTVDIWGHTKKTTWNSSLLEKNDNDCFIFTASDLGIDKIMRDISSSAECDISVQIYDDENELDPYEGKSNIYTNPCIASGDVTLDEFVHNSTTPFASPVISFTDFDYFTDMGCYDEFTITSTSDKGSISKKFNMSQMDEYLEVDEYEDVDYYNLYLDDLGITENGIYDVSIKFDSDEGSRYYNGSFEVVDFLIDIPYGENQSEDFVDAVTSSIFRIILPANTTNRARVYLDGNKIIDKSLADIGVTTNPMGREEFAIYLNYLQITESGKYNVKLEVLDENNQLLRNVSTNIWVEVTNNSIEFKDILYFDDDYAEVFLGAPVSEISDIVLLLNGQKAGVGAFADIFGMIFELNDDFSNPREENKLIPGHYEAQAILVSPNGNQTLGEGSFSVLDDSGAVEIDVFANGTGIYLQIEGSMPDYDMEDQDLTILVDPDYDYSDDDEGLAFFDYSGDVLEELLDNELHTIYLGDFEQGNHIIRVEYRTHNEDIPIEDQDYFLRMFNVTVGDVNPTETVITASDVTADYNSGEMITATLMDANGVPIGGADVEISVGDIDEILTTNANGEVSLSTSGLNPGVYDAVITYEGDENYASSTISIQVIINKMQTNLSAVWDDEAKELTVTLVNDANGAPLSGASVVVNVDGKNYTAKINNKGKGVVYLTDLASGTHVATVSYNGGAKCNPSSANVTVFVKFDSRISAVYDDIAKKLTVTLLNDATGAPLSGASVVVNVNGASYTVKINSKGNGVVSLADLALGTYDVTVSFNGGAKCNPSNTSLQIVTRYNSRISAVYNDATKALTVTLVNDATGAPLSGASVVVNVEGKSYTAKVNGAGKAVVYLTDLTSGTHVATVSYNGGAKCNPSSANVTVFVKFDSRISAVYDDIAKKLTVTLLNDATGAPLSGASVVVNVNGASYTVKINSKGNGVVSLADLALGTYDVTVSFNGGAKCNPSNTSLQIVTRYNSRISAVYNDATKALTVTLVNDATGAPLSGASVVVNVGGVSSTVKVNGAGKGVVYLTNLEPGTYNATVSYNGGTKCNPAETAVEVIKK